MATMSCCLDSRGCCGCLVPFSSDNVKLPSSLLLELSSSDDDGSTKQQKLHLL